MKKNKISIIMPVYNTANYLADAIESVCSQNFDGAELVIVNDGSTDNSEKIIKDKMKEYSNIVYVSEKNMGLSYARKTGLNHSTGEYIYFMDSDDLLIDGSLDFMYSEITKNDLDTLMINAVFKNELDNDYGYRMDNKNVVSKMKSTEILSGNELLETMIKNREWRYAVWLYFTKRELLDNVTFFEKYIHEDSAFNYELLSQSNKVKFVDKDIYVYRLRKNSLMSKKQSIRNILGYINSYLIICKQNDSKIFKYENYLFEIRILDQIIEVYNRLDKDEQKSAQEEFSKIRLMLRERNNYYMDKYRDFFNLDFEKIQDISGNDTIDYLEVDIVDHCNLNCNNCMHFSQFAKEKYMSIDSFESDLKRLKDLTNGKLRRLVLMGGEPLLHKNINEFLEVASRYFSKANIQIVTNGILLDRMSDSFWYTCKKYDIQINITPYPINIDYYHLYNKVLNNGLRLFIYDNGNRDNKEFTELIFDENGSIDENYKQCWMAKNCANLKNGKIYLCPVVNNIDRYNSYHKCNYQVLDGDYIDIYKVKSVEEIKEFLSNPTPFCKHCNFKESKRVRWERFKK